MQETSGKAQKGNNGPNCFQHRKPDGGSSAARSPRVARLLKCGAAALIVGAVLMLCASVGALYQWKVRDRNVQNIHYSMRIDGELKEGSLEIDSENNLERFSTGSGEDEAVEIHDFEIGITGIRFFQGQKCYIRSQIKATLPDMGTHDNERQIFDLTDEVLPVKFDEDAVIWVAEDQPLKDARFLSPKILALCGDSPIYWLHPTHPKDGERRERDARRAKQRLDAEELEAAAAAAAAGRQGRERRSPEGDASRAAQEEEEEEREAQSAAGSAYNPENPYHLLAEAGKEEEGGAVPFGPMLDHLGICCSECQRSYTHCQRVCEPLRGHWPWPYNYRGCRVACRVILPCRWWVARILGVV